MGFKPGIDIHVMPNLFITFDNLFELITIIRLIIYICLDEGNLDFGVCKQQRRRPACIYAQSDQRLFYLRIFKYDIYSASWQKSTLF